MRAKYPDRFTRKKSEGQRISLLKLAIENTETFGEVSIVRTKYEGRIPLSVDQVERDVFKGDAIGALTLSRIPQRTFESIFDYFVNSQCSDVFIPLIITIIMISTLMAALLRMHLIYSLFQIRSLSL